jgi:hypothetical protein
MVETWEGSVNLNRSYQSASAAGYFPADSSGVVTWRISGTDGSCTYAGEAQVNVQTDLALDGEHKFYAARLGAVSGPKTITVDCPAGPPEAQQYSPMQFIDISTDTHSYTDGQTVLTGSRHYDGDPNNPDGVDINWTWNFTAG